MYVFNILGSRSKSGIDGFYGNCTSNSLKNYRAVFHGGLTFPPAIYEDSNFSIVSPAPGIFCLKNYCCCHCYIIIAILLGIK